MKLLPLARIGAREINIQRYYTMKKELKKLIFGDGINKICIPELARVTGIPASTLYYYRNKPENIRLDDLALICKAQGKDLEKWLGE